MYLAEDNGIEPSPIFQSGAVFEAVYAPSNLSSLFVFMITQLQIYVKLLLILSVIP